MRGARIILALLAILVPILLLETNYPSTAQDNNAVIFDPTVTNITNDSAVICWVGPPNSWGIVYYGESEDEVKAHLHRVDDTGRESGVVYIVLTGLDPGTIYYYQAVAYKTGILFESRIMWFKTATNSSKDGISFRGSVYRELRDTDEMDFASGALVFMQLKKKINNSVVIANASRLVDDSGNFQIDMGSLVTRDGTVIYLNFTHEEGYALDEIDLQIYFADMNTYKTTISMENYINFDRPAIIPLSTITLSLKNKNNKSETNNQNTMASIDFYNHGIFLGMVITVMAILSFIARFSGKVAAKSQASTADKIPAKSKGMGRKSDKKPKAIQKAKGKVSRGKKIKKTG